MESFFGETPPDPKSPTSPTYYAAPRLGANDDAGDLGSTLQPSRIRNGSNVGAKKMNRASTVSVMSGLGVPVGARTSGESLRASMAGKGAAANEGGNLSPDIAAGGSTPSARSPSAGSFLNRGRKMYNFFGHRPPSELISNHLADYFPYVQKKVLERTARNSMLRISSGSGGPSASLSALQGGSLPGTSWSDEKANPSSRLSTSSFGTVATTASGPKKRASSIRASKSYTSPPPQRQTHQNHRVSTSPPRTAIPEESFFNASSSSSTSEAGSVVGIPRLSISTDDGTTYSESESDADSVASKPPLLPPLLTSDESLSDSLGVFSPGGNNSTSATDPSHAVPWMSRERRGSTASASTSRMSMLSRYRKSRDKSDTASMLTVDEITAHVDKRVSMVSFAQSESDSEDGGGHSAYGGVAVDDEEGLAQALSASAGRRLSRASTIGTGVLESEDGDNEEEYDEEEEEEDVYSGDEDEEEDYEDEEEEIVEEDEHGKAFMSTGGESRPFLFLLSRRV